VKSNGPVPEEQFDEEKAAYVKDLYGDSTSEKVADWLQDCAKAVCVQSSKKSALNAIIGMSHKSCTRPVGERAMRDWGVCERCAENMAGGREGRTKIMFTCFTVV